MDKVKLIRNYLKVIQKNILATLKNLKKKKKIY